MIHSFKPSTQQSSNVLINAILFMQSKDWLCFSVYGSPYAYKIESKKAENLNILCSKQLVVHAYYFAIIFTLATRNVNSEGTCRELKIKRYLKV